MGIRSRPAPVRSWGAVGFVFGRRPTVGANDRVVLLVAFLCVVRRVLHARNFSWAVRSLGGSGLHDMQPKNSECVSCLPQLMGPIISLYHSSADIILHSP